MRLEDFAHIDEHREIMQTFTDTYFVELRDELTWAISGVGAEYYYTGGEPDRCYVSHGPFKGATPGERIALICRPNTTHIRSQTHILVTEAKGWLVPARCDTLSMDEAIRHAKICLAKIAPNSIVRETFPLWERRFG